MSFRKYLKGSVTMLQNNNQYFEVLNDIKNTLITTRNKIINNANKNLILMYYKIGLKLIENNKWGARIY